MKKCEIITQRRKELVQLAVSQPSLAGAKIRKLATELEQSQGTTERVRIMAELLHLSEATVFKDFAG